MNILVIGASGYTGGRLATELLARGHTVRGLVRDGDKPLPSGARGVELRIGDLANLQAVKYIAQDIDVIFNLAGYCKADTKTVRATLIEGTRNLIEFCDPQRLQKYVLASNLAVYGHPKPEDRLTETWPLKPDYALGTVTVEAEKLAMNKLPTIILRVASVYGPGRDYLEAIRGGRLRIINNGENWQSRIHVEDLVQTLLAVLERGKAGDTFLVGDDLPTTAREFFTAIAQAIDAPPPPVLKAQAAHAFGGAERALNWLSGKATASLNENIIGQLTANYFCLNAKLKNELGVTLKYPTYLEGYLEIIGGPGKSKD